MINPQQIRAARGLLGWSQADLAKSVGLSTTALNQIERNISKPRAANLQLIHDALSKAGVEFLPQSGVRLKANTFFSLEGPNCVAYLQDDIYQTLSPHAGTLLAAGVCDRDYAPDAKVMEHYYRRAAAAGITERLIAEEGDDFFLFPASFSTYRGLPKQYFHSLPFYLYGSKLAFLIWGEPVKLIIIDDSNLHTAFSGLFELMWQQAKPIAHKQSHFK